MCGALWIARPVEHNVIASVMRMWSEITQIIICLKHAWTSVQLNRLIEPNVNVLGAYMSVSGIKGQVVLYSKKIRQLKKTKTRRKNNYLFLSVSKRLTDGISTIHTRKWLWVGHCSVKDAWKHARGWFCAGMMCRLDPWQFFAGKVACARNGIAWTR